MKFAPNFCLYSKNKISPDYLVKFCFITSLLEKLTSLLFCLSTASTMPMADIKTSKDVPPAETNGSGMPVGGIEPVTTAMLIATWKNMSAPMPIHTRLENLSFAR